MASQKPKKNLPPEDGKKEEFPRFQPAQLTPGTSHSVPLLVSALPQAQQKTSNDALGLQTTL